MIKRPRRLHLLIIAASLALLAAGAWFYSNASDPVPGIPARTAGLSAPAVAAKSDMDVTLYFPNAKLGSDLDCGKVFPVRRSIADTVNDGALQQLLKGPTSDERKLGYVTSIPSGVKVGSVTRRKIAAGTQVLVDLSAEMRTVSGSCRVASARAQIEQTLLHAQPDPPASVVISVEGETSSALQP